MGWPRDPQICVQPGRSPRLPDEAAVLAACCRSPSPAVPGQFCLPCPAHHTSFRGIEGIPHPGPGGAPASAFTALFSGSRSETIASPWRSPTPFLSRGPRPSRIRGLVCGLHRSSATATHSCPLAPHQSSLGPASLSPFPTQWPKGSLKNINLTITPESVELLRLAGRPSAPPPVSQTHLLHPSAPAAGARPHHTPAPGPLHVPRLRPEPLCSDPLAHGWLLPVGAQLKCLLLRGA